MPPAPTGLTIASPLALSHSRALPSSQRPGNGESTRAPAMAGSRTVDPRKNRQFGVGAFSLEVEDGWDASRTETVRDAMGWAGCTSTRTFELQRTRPSGFLGVMAAKATWMPVETKFQSRKLRLAKAAWRPTRYRDVPPSGP
ncbi:hypothetical protein MAPG_07346 [Magnaporthiopsis poae ATCC 64411]|uniref:Uncharacterized protein n=1 Tax=Magnaporthiopsis poae (strain ATCC 64411 / 73-15) TaxID=644358 RepID=A0A0C4E4F3_MAGP6|nr:hypothetical protein MAPG_07346 [Magnaporthiopsis poae ATCC 64411]